MYRRTFLFVCVFVGVQSNLFPGSNTEPCRHDDSVCLTKFSNHLLKTAIDGYAPFKIENLDPMSQEYVEGTFAIIKYHLRNSTVVGLKNCRIVDTKLILEQHKMNLDLICPYLYMYGKYDIAGTLIIVPMEGNGNYRIDAIDYHISVDIETRTIQGKDGKGYLNFKRFKANPDLRGRMTMDLTNLFNGQHKELADTALRFANEQWRLVAKEFQGPIITTNVKKVIKNMNKCLKHVPLEKILITHNLNY